MGESYIPLRGGFRLVAADSGIVCQLSKKEEAIMRGKLEEIIKCTEDQVLIIQLGQIDKRNNTNPNEWKILGKKLEISDNSIMII